MFWKTARLPRRALLLVAGIGAGLVVSAVALATIPDSNGVIHACYKKSGGALRVIDNSVTNCAGSETSLNWNVQGAQGIQGPAGQQGEQGPPGISGREIIVSGFVNLDPGEGGSTSAICPQGKMVVGGGFETEPNSSGFAVYRNRPAVLPGVDIWEVGGFNTTQGQMGLAVYAVCANVAP